jgi:hypothetical protein
MRNPAPYLPDALDWYGVRHEMEEAETPRKTHRPSKGRKTESESAKPARPMRQRRKR